MFSNGKTFTKKYSIFAINVVYIWETLLLDQHVLVAEWSKAPANHSRDQGGVGSIPSPAKNFFFESNFLFSPRVSDNHNNTSSNELPMERMVGLDQMFQNLWKWNINQKQDS